MGKAPSGEKVYTLVFNGMPTVYDGQNGDIIWLIFIKIQRIKKYCCIATYKFLFNNNEIAHLCIGDSTVKVIYYKHTINVYHVYVWI